MKKSFIALAVLIVLFCFFLIACRADIGNTSYLNMVINNVADATEDDFYQFNSAFNSANGDVKFVIDDYRLVKVNCDVINENNYDVNIFRAINLNDDSTDIYIPPENLDIEPTYPVASNSRLNVDFYIYVKRNIVSEEKIINELQKSNVVITYKVIQ